MCVLVRLATPQLSLAVGIDQVPMPEQRPGSAGKVSTPGSPLIEGAWLSITVTSKLALAVFPWMSVAV
jgi:hypothetical protein